MIKTKTRHRKDDGREYTVEEFLNLCKTDPTAYASPAERLLTAIGEPEVVDTSTDPRLGLIFSNRIIRRYPAFKEFYGVEDVIERIVGYLRHSSQGLEERKQILYFLGPVGGGKSSLAERLKALMEQVPFYALKAKAHKVVLEDGEEEEFPDTVSPIFENPLGLFKAEEDGDWLESEYGIPRRYLKTFLSPWAAKRAAEFEELYGDDWLDGFRVVKMYPSVLHRRGIAQTVPGDENNQDISSLVGKVDIRMIERYKQDDPDAYNFSGALCYGNRGILDFVEMFKAPIKVLNPLLTATQEGSYHGTENGGAVPFDGIIIAHSNESEWESFQGNKRNEAFLDRVYVVKVPYCLRATEEEQIYQKLLRDSGLAAAPCAPKTVRMLAEFIVLTRLKEPENSTLGSKMRTYDGENLKDTDPKAKSLQDYKDVAGINEGMTGLSTRFAFKIVSKVFNRDQTEIGANPVYLLAVLNEELPHEAKGEVLTKYQAHIKQYLFAPYLQFIRKEMQSAYMESYAEYGQNRFDRYIMCADQWIQGREFRDPDTGLPTDRESLNRECEKIEKPAGIANPKDFRNEVVNYVLRYRANNGGKSPVWTAYEKLRIVIEAAIFSNFDDILPVISFGPKKDEKDRKTHEGFVARMVEKGYTERMVRILVEWYKQANKSA